MTSSSQTFSKALKMYVAEAEFFEEVLARDVSQLPNGSHIVEIGAGIGLLALNLAAKGFDVTAFEPEASGFTEMHSMRELILSNWGGEIPNVNFVDKYIDAATKPDKPAEHCFDHSAQKLLLGGGCWHLSRQTVPFPESDLLRRVHRRLFLQPQKPTATHRDTIHLESSLGQTMLHIYYQLPRPL